MGVLGLISAVFMFGAIVKKAFSARQTIAPNCFALSAFISPLVFFFPLQTTNDFFGQFTNVFVWSALGVVLLVATFIVLLVASRFLKLDAVMFGKR